MCVGSVRRNRKQKSPLLWTTRDYGVGQLWSPSQFIQTNELVWFDSDKNCTSEICTTAHNHPNLPGTRIDPHDDTRNLMSPEHSNVALSINSNVPAKKKSAHCTLECFENIRHASPVTGTMTGIKKVVIVFRENVWMIECGRFNTFFPQRTRTDLLKCGNRLSRDVLYLDRRSLSLACDAIFPHKTELWNVWASHVICLTSVKWDAIINFSANFTHSPEQWANECA